MDEDTYPEGYDWYAHMYPNETFYESIWRRFTGHSTTSMFVVLTDASPAVPPIAVAMRQVGWGGEPWVFLTDLHVPGIKGPPFTVETRIEKTSRPWYAAVAAMDLTYQIGMFRAAATALYTQGADGQWRLKTDD